MSKIEVTPELRELVKQSNDLRSKFYRADDPKDGTRIRAALDGAHMTLTQYLENVIDKAS